MGKTQARGSATAKAKPAIKSKSSALKKKAAPAARKGTESPFIDTLSIENFKSIKSMKLKPKRVNVFIGEPNSGKTNILEALALQSVGGFEETFLKDILRVRNCFEMFHNQNTESPVIISNNLLHSLLEVQQRLDGNSSDSYEYSLSNIKTHNSIGFFVQSSLSHISSNVTQFQKDNKQYSQSYGIESKILFYKYNESVLFNYNNASYLRPPFGNNLIHLLITNKKLRSIITSSLDSIGLKLRVIQHANQIEIVDTVDDISFVYPFTSLSETIRRQIFYSSILATCNQKVILLDEPDTHSFPAYVKQFAEEVGINEENQFFITTHNPYLLGSIIEKTPIKDLNIYVCRKKEGATEAICLSEKQLNELTEMGVSSSFFNLDDFYPENA
ncbi:MAG: AAA family ATPase [Bacteroidia bacterium]|jgi:hypothetical protein|nr:AAA family ATPase [Bacteroidia bacterium]